MKRPSDEDIDLAVLWLRSYEGDDDETLARVQLVAAWLEDGVDRRRQEEEAVIAIVAESVKLGRPVTKTAARIFYRRNVPR